MKTMYESQITVRFFRRTHKPTMGFFPWGLVGLLLIILPLLLCFAWFARANIEANVREEVREELSLNNLNWVQVDVNGQGVKLSGEGSKREGDRAVSLVKKVKGATWLGALTAPIRVKGAFSEPAAVSPPVQRPIPTNVPKPIWGDVISTLKSGVLTVHGYVGNQVEKNILLKIAKENINPPRITKVIDELNVSPLPLLEDSKALAKRTIETIVLCDSGQARSAKGVYSINCQTQLNTVKSVRQHVSKPLSGGELGQIIVSTSSACNASFAKTLEGKTINFDVGSAQLKASSTLLMDQILEIAKACPGTIRVEGHTDDTGSLEANMILSHARAESVLKALVDRGIQQKRLVAQGFGPTQPRAEGTSSDARALNRRIEFKVSE